MNYNENIKETYKENVSDIPTLQKFIRAWDREVYKSGKWIFRGSGNEEWELEPAFLRFEESTDKYNNFDFFYSRHDMLINNHHRALKENFLAVDHSNEGKPTEGQISFSQHYGLKTLLLDWSYNPVIALWFAIEQWVTGDRSKNIALWCLDQGDVTFTFERALKIDTEPYRQHNIYFELKFIEPNYKIKRNNYHIQNQKGLHTYVDIFKLRTKEYAASRQIAPCINGEHLKDRRSINFTEDTKKLLNIDHLLTKNEITFHPHDEYTQLTQTASESFKKIIICKNIIPDILKIIEYEIGSKNLYPSFHGSAHYAEIICRLNDTFPKLNL